MTESVGDVGRFGWVPAVVFGVCVEMMVEWSGRCCLPGFEREDDAPQGPDRTHVGVGIRFVANLFAANRILLVRELQCCVGDLVEIILVIQRCGVGVVDFAVDGEMDVAKFEGLASGVGVVISVLGRTEQPVEGDDDKVDAVTVEDAPDRVVGVQGVSHGAEDRDVDRVGPSGRVVLSLDGFTVISKYGMELVSWSGLGWIWEAQVGNPLANGREGCLNCVRLNRDVTAAVLSVPEREDEEIEDFVSSSDITEVRGLAVLLAEVVPVAEVGVTRLSCLGGSGSGGDFESSVDISCEATLDGRCSIFQGLGCG